MKKTGMPFQDSLCILEATYIIFWLLLQSLFQETKEAANF